MIRAWRYRTGIEGHESVDPHRVITTLDAPREVVWIDCSFPTRDELDQLGRELHIGQIVIDDLAHQRQRTKLQRYGDYFHVAVHDCELRDDMFTSREIDIVLGEGWILTVRHPGDDGVCFDTDRVTHRFELQRAEHDSTQEGFLLWALFDVIVDRYFDTTDAFDERLDHIEERVFANETHDEITRQIFSVRRDLMEFRRAVAPLREVVNAIIRGELPFVQVSAIVHFHDIYDRVLRAVDLVESQRDLLTGLLDAELAVISNRLNQVMKKMTSWGAILIVATLIAGIYG